MLDRSVTATKAMEAGTRLTVRSALNPILWLCGLITIPSFGAWSAMVTEPPTWWVVLAMMPVCAAVIGFFFLLVIDRDKLQSEDYQIRKQTLEMIQESGDTAPKMISVAELDAIAEPAPKQLQPPRNPDK